MLAPVLADACGAGEKGVAWVEDVADGVAEDVRGGNSRGAMQWLRRTRQYLCICLGQHKASLRDASTITRSESLSSRGFARCDASVGQWAAHDVCRQALRIPAKAIRSPSVDASRPASTDISTDISLCHEHSRDKRRSAATDTLQHLARAAAHRATLSLHFACPVARAAEIFAHAGRIGRPFIARLRCCAIRLHRVLPDSVCHLFGLPFTAVYDRDAMRRNLP
jgi:hypothetical protein